MSPSRRALCLVSAAVLAHVAGAAPASAATIQTFACNVDTRVVGAKSVPLVGTGFTPGAGVTIRTTTPSNPDPVFLTAAVADAAGNFKLSAVPPLFRAFDTQEQTFGLVATDDANPALVAAAQFVQVRLGYVADPATGPPDRRSTHTVRGFPIGKIVWLHFRHGGRTRASIPLGRTQAPCGKASRRMALLPTRSRRGKWTVYVDQVRTYSPDTKLQLTYSFVISRTFG
jgi:hypothetical protein